MFEQKSENRSSLDLRAQQFGKKKNSQSNDKQRVTLALELSKLRSNSNKETRFMEKVRRDAE